MYEWNQLAWWIGSIDHWGEIEQALSGFYLCLFCPPGTPIKVQKESSSNTPVIKIVNENRSCEQRNINKPTLAPKALTGIAHCYSRFIHMDSMMPQLRSDYTTTSAQSGDVYPTCFNVPFICTLQPPLIYSTRSSSCQCVVGHGTEIRNFLARVILTALNEITYQQTAT